MASCTEVVIYKVTKENFSRVFTLSQAVIEEMNAVECVITSYEILQNTDNLEEICWYLTWVSEKAAKLSAEKWSTLPSAKALMSFVDEKLYFGHFVAVIK